VRQRDGVRYFFSSNPLSLRAGSGGPGEGRLLAGVGAFAEVEVDQVLVRDAGLFGNSGDALLISVGN
jgi:hypothetical protein